MNLPKGFGKVGATAYKPTTVARKSVMHFEAGQPVFILDDPDGTPWVMQAFTTKVDPSLTYEGLKTLGDKLKLPNGWSYRVLIEGDMPMSGGATALFIDCIGVGGGVGRGFHGVGRGRRGVGVR